MMKKLTFIVSLVVLMVSCSKEKDPAIFTGQILENCSGTPLANTPLTITRTVQCASLTSCFESYSASTDKDGNFSFTIPGSYFDKLKVGQRVILRHTSHETKLGTFYANPTTSFVYRIKVNNPYQVGDTLLLNLRGKQDRIPAPLHDSIFSSVLNHTPLATQTYPLDGTIPVIVNYGVFRGPINIINAQQIKSEKFTFNLPICPTKIDTITIEIN